MRFDNKDGRIRGARGVAIRAAFLDASPLCKRCEELGLTRVAEEVDHIIPLHAGGEDVQSNKQGLCKPHHLEKTLSEQGNSLRGQIFPEWVEPASCPLTVVFGPPGSGKSTYVREHASPDDTVIDLDVIKAEITGLPLYHGGLEGLDPAIRARNRMLGELKRSTMPAWFITSGSGNADRKWWIEKLKPSDVITLRPSPAECIRRIKADTRRPLDAQQRQCKAVREWFFADGRGWKMASPMGFDAAGNPLNPRHQGNQ